MYIFAYKCTVFSLQLIFDPCIWFKTFQLLNSIPNFVTSVISKLYPTRFNFALDTSLKDVIESMNDPSTISKPINLVYHIGWMIPTERM